MHPSALMKSDEQALRKKAKFFPVKGADLYYTCRGVNRNDVFQSQASGTTIVVPI